MVVLIAANFYAFQYYQIQQVLAQATVTAHGWILVIVTIIGTEMLARLLRAMVLWVVTHMYVEVMDHV